MYVHRYGPILMFTLLIGVSVGAEINDPIVNDLEKAKKTYNDAYTKARESMLKSLDDTIRAVAKTGDLEQVKALEKERRAFEEASKVPTSTKLKTATTEYLRLTKIAGSDMSKAYDKAVKDLTKGLKIDLADLVQNEFKQFGKNNQTGLVPLVLVDPRMAAEAGKLSGSSQSGFDYQFYTAKAGAPPTKMLHKDDGICYLVGLTGSTETADISLDKEGYWVLTCKGTGDISVRAVGIKFQQRK